MSQTTPPKNIKEKTLKKWKKNIKEMKKPKTKDIQPNATKQCHQNTSVVKLKILEIKKKSHNALRM